MLGLATFDHVTTSRPPVRRRVAALGAIGLGAIGALLLLAIAVSRILVFLLALVSLALLASGVVRGAVSRGRHRGRWLVLGAIGLVLLVVCVVLVAIRHPWASLAAVVAVGAAGACGVYAQRGYLRAAAAPEVAGRPRRLAADHRVLFLNPKSGGGKVQQFDLVAEARRRGVQAVVLERDDDLTTLAERAVADGAEVLGMAGGDGSQADVAAVCVAHDLPFVCIPAGTRNHFALDLNLDRSDPSLALDAFDDGIEIRVDHGWAGDRFFVNNVSLGMYPYIVEDPNYRDGRLKAAADLLPALMEGDRAIDLQFRSPTGTDYTTAQVLLVSNNPYRGLVGLDGAGRRVSLQGGELGVLVLAAADAEELAAAARRLTLGVDLEHVPGCDQWSAPELRVDSAGGSILAGVDGEAMDLPTPLLIRVVPAGLRVVVPVGTSAPPATTERLLSSQALGSLLEIAGGVDQGPYGDDL
jgi:diacylglycerol kinase family enzyme